MFTRERQCPTDNEAYWKQRAIDLDDTLALQEAEAAARERKLKRRLAAALLLAAIWAAIVVLAAVSR